jgi:hypothetical protein
LRYVGEQLALALQRGLPVAGVCWYPWLDYPGWDDERYCSAGVFGYPDGQGDRAPFHPLWVEMQALQERFAKAPEGDGH